MFCPSCGTQCVDDAKFCPNCGHSFAQVQNQPSSEKTATYYSAPVEMSGAPNGYNPNPAGGYNSNGGFVPNPGAPVAKRYSTAVLVLGIVATLINSGLGCLCGCLGSIPGVICAIIGLVLGFKGKKTYAPGEKDKKNDIGIILCFVALGILVVVSILNAILGAGMAMYEFY